MIMEVFSVYDKAVKAYMQPFFARTRGEALRNFSQAVNDEKSNLHIHAADYTLFSMGSFDDGPGSFTSIDPQRIVSALECLVDDNPFKPEAELREVPSFLRKS